MWRGALGWGVAHYLCGLGKVSPSLNLSFPHLHSLGFWFSSGKANGPVIAPRDCRKGQGCWDMNVLVAPLALFLLRWRTPADPGLQKAVPMDLTQSPIMYFSSDRASVSFLALLLCLCFLTRFFRTGPRRKGLVLGGSLRDLTNYNYGSISQFIS